MIDNQERELIGIGAKASLQAARERGAVLGKPEKLNPAGRLEGSAATKQDAINLCRTTLGSIKLLREQGMCPGMSYDHIAKMLNKEGHKTR